MAGSEESKPAASGESPEISAAARGGCASLARLRDAGFVRDRREGSQSFYALALEGLPRSAVAALDEATGSEDPTLEGDQRRLVELDEERRGGLPESFACEMDRHYSPGRTWQSLAMGMVAVAEYYLVKMGQLIL